MCETYVTNNTNTNLVPRVSLLCLPWSKRDPGNEVAPTLQRTLFSKLMIPPVKWHVLLEVKILILVMCIKGIIQLWILILAYSATLTSVSNHDLRYVK